MAAERQLERLLRRSSTDPAVLAVLLFGSAARAEASAHSDVDVCLVAREPRRPIVANSRQCAWPTSATWILDVHVFQALPLYIRTRVLKEGKVLFCRDEDALYEVAFATIRAFERFKRTYRAYLDEVAHG